MKNRIIILFFGVTITLINAQTVKADTVDNAMKLCAVFDGTGMLSEKCDVSGSSQSVDVSIDTSSKEAIEICKQVSSMMAKDSIHFEGGHWKIKIYSPFSNGKTIATCKLPA
ncbi:MAG: hypothetical protein Q8L15_02280 [Methylobacter sp.]|jgi:hypothetical protein|nr:hypothetical protein [Methylobacter sp.]